MPVTIKDIARRAGVSHPTVSRALHGDPLVAAETAARIRRLAAELGYVPSATARSLKTNRSRVVGVIVNRISDPFYGEVLDGIQDVLHPAGYSLFLASTNHNLDRQQGIVRAMEERRVDGLIACSLFIGAQDRMQLGASDAPLVVVHNRATDAGGNAIYHDDRYGSQQLTRHLIQLGHTRIAFIGNMRGGRETEDRLVGFREEMQTAGLSAASEYVVQAPNGQLTSGQQAVQPLLGLLHPPTALICFNDMLAIGALQRLLQSGCHVPGDISVVGFDGISFASFVSPPLTTFDQPKYQLGEEAAHMMLRLLNPKTRQELNGSTNIVTMRGQMLVRASTAPPAVS